MSITFWMVSPPFGPEIREDATLTVVDAPRANIYDREYHFTQSWFPLHVSVWEAVLARYTDKPNVQYLEIGLFEGGSAMWVLDNILTHPTSHMTGIDPFEDTESHEAQFPTYPERFRANLDLSGATSRTTVIQGFSQTAMRDLPLEHYDIIYIDGSHEYEDALEDAVRARRLLKPGGVLIIDDYLGIRTVRRAANQFYWAFGEEFELTHKGRQLILTKV